MKGLMLLICPKDKSYGKYAAIFEVRRSENESELKDLAEQALGQIKEKKYYEKMKNLGYSMIS